MKANFNNIYTHGFARVAVGVPRSTVADPVANVEAILALAREASSRSVAVMAFPELGISGYTCDDLFHQSALLDGCERALITLAEASRDLPMCLVVGVPLRVRGVLFNCAAVISQGEVRGIVPKSYLPNYAEFYESRQFSAADPSFGTNLSLDSKLIPLGANLLFQVSAPKPFTLHVEICEDVWVPVPPSSFGALAGATLLVNLSASNVVVGKSAYRHALVSQQSARCLAAYMYTSAGQGESTTDMAWDGQAIIYENGELLGASSRFSSEPHVTYADIDLDRLEHERMRMTTFADSVRRHAIEVAKFKIVSVPIDLPIDKEVPLERDVPRFPYVPYNEAELDDRCSEVYRIQVQGLEQRLRATGIERVVIGVSGGLDSTHALLVCAETFDRLGKPRSNIIGVTMPGFATSQRTLDQARRLMKVVGCEVMELDIKPSCEQMLRDIGHPYARGEPIFDITFENVQSGERTSHLFRLANARGGLVVGTGDLSELALGWCTYGVGDHMSHYNVNASVPKTLISYLVRWVAQSGKFDGPGAQVLVDVASTEISPELVPEVSANGGIQRTEDFVGPYELQDFNLYYILRYGFSPSKIVFLARRAWGDRHAGRWPTGVDSDHREYGIDEIRKFLRIFLDRFFRTSQFKRSVAPNSPKVGTGGSLSPRGDWRAPSDSAAAAWLAELDKLPSSSSLD